jgi:hypothetical protein
MKLDKYNKLRLKLEVFKLEKNYNTLDRVLYYFSFLGNIFLIYFGYFFVKTVTNSIPPLFPFQDLFFTIFVALFLTGYELTKRFTLHQYFIELLQIRKATSGLLFGSLICIGMITGSFYLSIKGAHRLVDNTATISITTDSLSTKAIDSIAKYYDKEISYYRSQPAARKADRVYRDSIVAGLEKAKEVKVKEIEQKTGSKTQSKVEENAENSTAFLFITIFLELLVLIGVGFNAFYNIGSYKETKELLQTPKYKQLELNLKLLKLYYQNGKKTAGDPILSLNKFKTIVQIQKINCLQKDIKAFTTLCQELDIVKDAGGRKKELAIPYEEAKQLLENQEEL